MSDAGERDLLFVPGRASYVTSSSDRGFELTLSDASQRRAEVAAGAFDEDRYAAVIFAGRCPGLSQNWPLEHYPQPGKAEADLMAAVLERRLMRRGWSENQIESYVLRQTESDNSIGDVAHSMELGYLNPDDFHRSNGIDKVTLVTGGLHGARFRMILTKALDLEPSRITRIPMHDIYGSPATEFRPRNSAAVAVAKEFGAIALTHFILKDTLPGNLDSLYDAEDRFKRWLGIRH